MWDHYSRKAREAVGQATVEAMGLGQDHIAPGHLLLGLVRRDDNVALRVMGRMGVSRTSLAEAVTHHLATASDDDPACGLQLTADARTILQSVYDEARRLRHRYVGTEHLLLALAGEPGAAGDTLRAFGITHQRACREIQALQSRME